MMHDCPGELFSGGGTSDEDAMQVSWGVRLVRAKNMLEECANIFASG